MKINLTYTPKKRVDISAFAEFAGEGDYITVLKIGNEAKQTIRFHQMSTSTNKFSKWMGDKLRNKEIDPEEFVKDKSFLGAYTNMVQEMNDEEIEKSSHSIFMVEKLTIEHGLDSKEHSITDEAGKPIILNHDTLKLLVEASPKFEKFVAFILKEINDYNKEDSICLGESSEEKLVM